VIACFPGYRSYVDDAGGPSEARPRLGNPAGSRERNRYRRHAFDFIYKVLWGDLVAEHRSGLNGRYAVLRCAMKLQQYSGPVMAKGLEDTAFFRYNQFIGLNEVGGHPDRFGVTLAAFHKANAQRDKRWPRTILGTSIHDTKRGEDARVWLC